MTTPAMTVRTLREGGDGDVEIVEHKGTGHPDTICDAIAEAASLALSRAYVDRFGAVLHHNLDKALLVGGRAEPAFGGGRVVAPIALYVAGRATEDVRGVRVPVSEIVIEAARGWLAEHMHAVDPHAHVRIEALVRPGSNDLVQLFLRQAERASWLANDTSCGAGYAPLSPTERTVLEVARALGDFVPQAPEYGEDVKIMAVRGGQRLALTVACAHVGGRLRDLEHYLERREALGEHVRTAAESVTRGALAISVAVNAADAPEAGSVYITVTGTSAEAGDDGQVGRGNRVNRLITPYRPMTLEAAAGKNPVSHVGKLYNVGAHLIAADVVAAVPEVARCECFLVSRIGRPVDEPQLADVGVALREPSPHALDAVRPRIEGVVADGIAHLPSLWKRILRGELRVF